MFAIYLTKVCDPEVGVLNTDIFVGQRTDRWTRRSSVDFALLSYDWHQPANCR